MTQETRTQQLHDHFRDLLFFHVELALPPIPSSSTSSHDFPRHLILTQLLQETWGYMELLQRYLELNAAAIARRELHGGEDEDWSKGLDGTEPERGLMMWLEAMVTLVRLLLLSCPFHDDKDPFYKSLEMKELTLHAVDDGTGQSDSADTTAV